MSPSLGAWLRKQREDRLWSQPEMARRLIKAAEDNGDLTMPSTDDVAHNIYRWERGIVSPTERYRLYYCDVLGIRALASASQARKPRWKTPPRMPRSSSSSSTFQKAKTLG